MLGFNGGLKGIRRVPATEAASGLWMPNEQSVAKRAGIWPQVQEPDPYFANVSLLLHMDGSNGSTTFADSSSNGFTVTANGNAQVATANPKFGSGSLALDGSGDYLTFPANNALQLGTGDFTVECWVFLNPGNTNNGLFTFGGMSSGLMASVVSGEWYMSTGGVIGGGQAAQGSATTNAWQHFAMTRSGSTLRMFINGSQLGAAMTTSTDLTDNAIKIGYYYAPAYSLSGLVDEFRVTKGIARYTANFTPPTAPFPNA